MQHGTKAVAKSDYLRAFEVDLPIEPHEQLHSFKLRVPGRHIAAAVYEFVGEVLNGVAQDLKGAPRLGSDAAKTIGS